MFQVPSDREVFQLLKAFAGQSGCAKKQIVAGTYVAQGGFLYATNYCDFEGEQCPRLDMPSGEGYHLCQAHHAEARLAEKIKQFELITDVAWVYGHYWACEPCASALKNIGIRELRIRETI